MNPNISDILPKIFQKCDLAYRESHMPLVFRTPKYTGPQKQESKKNIRDFENYIKKDIILLNQCHSSNIVVVDKDSIGKQISSDAMITISGDIAIGIIASDCLPIFLYDAQKKILAGIHAGREGSFLWITTQTLKKMQLDFWTSPKDIFAYIAPGICSQCYEIALEIVPEKFRNYIYSWEIFWEEKVFLDLKMLNKQMLIEVGVPEEQIEISLECTYTSEKFHSYRKKLHGKNTYEYGNNLFVMWMK